MSRGGEGRRKGKEGLERSASGKQSERRGPLSSQDDVCMHLTNYAINKHNENFVRDDAAGSKRYSRLWLCLSLIVSAAPETELALGRPIAQENHLHRPLSCA